MKTEWVHKKLGDLGYSYSGLSGKTIDDFGEGKAFIPYMNIFSNGEIDPNKLEYVRIADNEHQNKVEQGDWFFTTSSETPEEVGMTSVLVDNIGEAYLNSFCFGFRLYNKQEFDPKFASYLFRSEELRKKISLFAQGSTRYNLPKQQMFEKLFISYPESLTAQRRIAAILASADKVIASTQKIIAKYKQIKQGMMEELLKPKEGWKMVRLGECCEDVFSGKNTKRQDFGKYIVYGSTGPIGYSEDYEYDFDAVLVARVGANAGLVNKVSGLYDVSDNTLIIKILKNIDLNYLYYLLIHLNLNQFIFGSGQPLVTAGLLKKIEIPIPYKNGKPDLTEQRRIAAILSGIDAKIAAEEKVLEKYEKVKKGLMERLLEGNNMEL